ncbi:hypothetical protein AVEN_87366-1 [Araneus ventricosus]|uniref:Uncharacterized protein n=1 Tax=Araneus ventricosus TaxID=182803 RepID=A0A4Y2K6E3_ARAVE|nr:hypothetical protein AVEN_87366-1 [Araneus ventricosus]
MTLAPLTNKLARYRRYRKEPLHLQISDKLRPRWVRFRLRGQKAPGSKHDSTKDPSCMWTCCTLNLTSWIKCPHACVVRKFGKGGADQVSSSSSDRDSKLRGPPQNNPRVASTLIKLS